VPGGTEGGRGKRGEREAGARRRGGEDRLVPSSLRARTPLSERVVWGGREFLYADHMAKPIHRPGRWLPATAHPWSSMGQAHLYLFSL
jgi:hypothetical protein